MPDIPRYYQKGRAPAPYVDPKLYAKRGIVRAQGVHVVEGAVGDWAEASRNAAEAGELLTATTDFAVSMRAFMEAQSAAPRLRVEGSTVTPAYQVLGDEFETFAREQMGLAMSKATSRSSRAAISSAITTEYLAQQKEISKLSRTWEIEHHTEQLNAATDAAADAGRYDVAAAAVESAWQGGFITAKNKQARLEDLEGRAAWADVQTTLNGDDTVIENMIFDMRATPDPRLSPAQQREAMRAGHAELDRRESERNKEQDELADRLYLQIEGVLDSGGQPDPALVDRAMQVSDPARASTIRKMVRGQQIDGHDDPDTVIDLTRRISMLGVSGSDTFEADVRSLTDELASARFDDGTISKSRYDALMGEIRKIPRDLVSSEQYQEARRHIYAQVARVPGGDPLKAELSAMMAGRAFENLPAAYEAFRRAQQMEMDMAAKAREEGMSFDPRAWAEEQVAKYMRSLNDAG